jgi:MFS family permease
VKESSTRRFYGPQILAACFFVMFTCWGTVINLFPVLVKPITEDMNWGRGALAVALAVGSLATAVTSPIAGSLVDRIGARSVMSVGALVVGIGLLAGSRVAELWQLYLVFALIGSGVVFSTMIPCSLVISNWFISRRGTAMAIAFMGASAGGMVMSPVANWIVLRWGWRTAFVVSGVEILLLVMPLIGLVIRSHPSEMGLEPYHREAADTGEPSNTWGVTTRQALSVPVFWQLSVIMFVIGIGTATLSTHCVAHLVDLGHSPTRAALAWSLVNGISMVGILLSGPMADRWGARTAVVSTLVLFAVSIALLNLARPYAVALAFATLYGLPLAAPFVLVPLLIGGCLGMRSFGALYGVLNVMGTAGAVIGPVLAGVLFDAKGTYLPVFYFIAAAMLASAGVSLRLRAAKITLSASAEEPS